MKKKWQYLILLILCVGIVTYGLQPSKKSKDQKVRMQGSTSMEELVNGLSEVIRGTYPDLLLEPQFTGSSAGIEAIASGVTDIGMSSRSLKQNEIDKGLIGHVVALDGMVMITHPSNTVGNINKQQLRDIYLGKIRNWREVGGPDQNIVVLGRESGSGTRVVFEELLNITNACKYAQELNETGAVVAKVGSIPGAIGYVSLNVVNKTVKALQYNHVGATVDSILSGKYVLQRPYVLVTNGSLDAQSESVQAVFSFLKSDDGKSFLKKVGLVSPE